MATYAIGDIQGCFDALQRLLARFDFDPAKDRLWFVGDLVNRGPRSLDVLRWAYEHRDAVTAVLGNHDLHVLAVSAGVRDTRARDTVSGLLAAPDRDELLDWLRHRPFLHNEGEYLMVHAGLLPDWSIEDATRYARQLEAALRGPQYPSILEDICGASLGSPDSFDSAYGPAALAAVFTRLRVCAADGSPSYEFSGALQNVPKGLVPWFAFPGRRSTGSKILFGHWAALGLHVESGTFALDSGCVWGGALTALRLDDEAIIQVRCDGDGR